MVIFHILMIVYQGVYDAGTRHSWRIHENSWHEWYFLRFALRIYQMIQIKDAVDLCWWCLLPSLQGFLNSPQGPQNCHRPWRIRPSASNVSSAKIHNGMAWGNEVNMAHLWGALNHITVHPVSLSHLQSPDSMPLCYNRMRLLVGISLFCIVI